MVVQSHIERQGGTLAKLLHCVHLPGNSPKITCHLSASTAKQGAHGAKGHTRGSEPGAEYKTG